jgi:hypothetical protein
VLRASGRCASRTRPIADGVIPPSIAQLCHGDPVELDAEVGGGGALLDLHTLVGRQHAPSLAKRSAAKSRICLLSSEKWVKDVPTSGK